MEKQYFENIADPTISITECNGSLLIRGWARNDVRIRATEGDYQAQQEGDTIMLSCRADLRVDAPFNTSVQVQTIRGDGRIKGIQGAIKLAEVNGDLVLSRVGPAEVQLTNGDLAARIVDGDLQVGTVHGDMSVRRVAGRLEVEQIGRDLGARELMADAQVVLVRGDIRLRTDFTPEQQVQLKANGDIVARVPNFANADFILRSGRGNIRVKANLTEKTKSENEITGRLGDGGADVLLEAGRDLILVARGDQDTEWSDLGAEIGAIGADIGIEFAGLAEQIAAQIEVQMEHMSAQLEEKLSSMEIDMAAMDRRSARAAERIATHTQQKLEQAAEKLRRTAEREAEKARRKAARHRSKAAQKQRTYYGRSPEPRPADEQITEDERMAILNMVAEGKISVEDAETLLDALKG